MQKALLTRVVVGIALIVGGMVPGGMILADGGHGYEKGKSPHGGHTMGHHRSVSPLAMKDLLGLSNDQVKTLEPLESNYRKTSIKHRAELKIAMIDLSTLLDQGTPDKTAISKKVDEIGTIQKNMMQFRVDAMLELKKALTSAQYDKFREEIKEHMNYGMGGSQHGMREMMPHSGKSKHGGYSHEKMDGHHGK